MGRPRISLGFGLAGASFAVGIAYTSVWFPKNQQGTALGIFGAGNAGAALTSILAPSILIYLTTDGANIDGWRTLPKLYAGLPWMTDMTGSPRSLLRCMHVRLARLKKSRRG